MSLLPHNYNGWTYWIYWSLFKIFEIVLFLFPAFPPTLSMRIGILIIYVVGHIYGVQTYYKVFKQDTLNTCILEQKSANNDLISKEYI